LSFCGEAGDIGDERFFLTAIQTQGSLLQKCAPQPKGLGRATTKRSTVLEDSISSGTAICVGWLIKRPTCLEDTKRTNGLG
jgi:hypothetical protein